nr:MULTISPECIES: hypothetical protein [unclassified Streptomyces]
MAWSLATGAAVTLSWWGVHTVLSGTVYDPPRALPLPAGPVEEPEPTEEPTPSPTRQPETTPSSATASRRATPDPVRTTEPAAPATTPAPTTEPAPDPATPRAGSGAKLKTYTVDGGRVTFALGKSAAELVSATPTSGWQMQVWKQPMWIRVTFTGEGRELSVFALWHDSAPRVEISDRKL